MVVAIANRKKSQRGRDVMRATTGHPTQAMITPMIVNFA
jgi:hypothetical protein